MSGFNKITSFVLGLIVVLVFLLVFGSRINLSDKLLAFRSEKSVTTPTPTPTLSVTPTPKKGFFESLFGAKSTPTPTPTSASMASSQSAASPQGMTNTPKNIPSTGPELLFPIAISAFGSGLYLRRKK